MLRSPSGSGALALGLSLALAPPLASPLDAQEAWPDPGWQPVADLEAAGWSAEGLAAARRLADSVGTAAYMVVEEGRVVDTYGDVTHRYRAHSVRKSLLSDRLAGDARAALDYLERLAAGDTAPGMRGALDLDRVDIVGHSRGGSTVTRGCATDPRLRACVVLDNIGSRPETERGLDQPQLAVRAPWSESRAGRLHEFLEANRSAAFEVVLPGTKHMSFTDVSLVDPETHPPGELGPRAAHRALSTVLLGFLDEYLRGGPGGLRGAAAAH